MRKPTNRHRELNTGTHTRFVLIFFCLLYLVLALRLIKIQIISHDSYKSLAYSQYIETDVIPQQRGNIISIDGYVLAGNQVRYRLYAEPARISDKYRFFDTLSKVLAEIDLDDSPETTQSNPEKLRDTFFSEYYSRLSENFDPTTMWMPVRSNLSPDDRDRIAEKKIEGIGFEEEPARYYPEGQMVSHILGFVGNNEKGEKVGYYGIEGGMNGDLKGKPGRISQEVDSMGRPILLGNFKKIPPVQGRDLVVTVNRSVQYLVEKKLKQGVENYDALSGSAIVMDPNTGEILAMANYPSFDHNNLVFDQDEGSTVESETREKNDGIRKTVEYKNNSISSPYEPGSVIKPLTVAAAIDLKRVTPETTYVDTGPVWYSDKKVDNWDGKHLGVLNIVELLQKSNNIGAAWVGHEVGARDLYRYFTSFGIGQLYDLDLEGEEKGILREFQTWTDIELANVSFGQGMAATPLQVLNAFNVFANGGYLLQPKIVARIVDREGTIEIPTKVIRKVLSNEAAETMVMMLEKAAEGGEARYYISKDYRIAGKTGTAQIFIGGQYDQKKSNATFVGFLSGSKQFSMIVKLEEPQSSIYAADTAVPLWMDIANDLVKYYGIPPDKH